jgi:hypothetical protein
LLRETAQISPTQKLPAARTTGPTALLTRPRRLNGRFNSGSRVISFHRRF